MKGLCLDENRRQYREVMGPVRLRAGRSSYGPHTWLLWRSANGCGDRRAVRRAGNRDISRWSFWWYRKPRSSCGTRPDGLPVQPWYGHRGRRQGRSSVTAGIQRPSLFAISALTFLKVAAEPLPQLQPSPQQPRLHRRNAQLQRVCCFLGRKPFHVAQNKNRAEAGRKSLNRLAQDFLELGLVVLLLRIRTPVRDFAGD